MPCRGQGTLALRKGSQCDVHVLRILAVEEFLGICLTCQKLEVLLGTVLLAHDLVP